jgi:hypothetical protein
MARSGRSGDGQDGTGDGGLPFPDAAGCAGRRDGPTGGLHPCTAPPVGTVKHRPPHRRETLRVFVCEAHAVGQLDPRPLTPDDEAELRRRRRQVRQRRPSVPLDDITARGGRDRRRLTPGKDRG